MSFENARPDSLGLSDAEGFPLAQSAVKLCPFGGTTMQARLRGPGSGLMIALALVGCTAARPPPAATTFRERVAALALRQVAFGSVSLLPVRFANSRISAPFEDGGRTLYCVSSRMHGRSVGEPERAKVVIREEIGTERLSVVEDDEVCSGHATQPFPELEQLGNRAN